MRIFGNIEKKNAIELKQIILKESGAESETLETGSLKVGLPRVGNAEPSGLKASRLG